LLYRILLFPMTEGVSCFLSSDEETYDIVNVRKGVDAALSGCEH